MTATKAKRKPWKPKPSREQSMRTWLQAGQQRTQAARDEQRIDAAEYEREHPFVDQDAADRAQQGYEESIGWPRA